MREYSPELATHKAFLERYPEHRRIDKVSTAQFLNALVLFKRMKLEVEKKDAINIDDQNNQERTLEWAEKLKALLPSDVGDTLEFFDETPDEEAVAISRAIELYARKVPGREDLFVEGHIPNVYMSREYIYRARVRSADGAAQLDDRELGHAMFLHRGLRLQASAHRYRMIYQPYWYRANLLAKASPGDVPPRFNDGQYIVQLPSRRALAEKQTEYQKKLDEAYYSLLAMCSYAKPDYEFPFIGAAILDGAKGNVRRAVDDALEQRERFAKASGKWQDLMQAVAEGRKRDAEDRAEAIKQEIQQAAQPYVKGVFASFSVLSTIPAVIVENTSGKIAGKLTEAALKGILEAVPETAKQWFSEKIERVVDSIAKNPYRLLLTRHLDTLSHSYD